MRYRTTITISIFVLSVFVITKCMHKESDKTGVIQNVKGEQFAGSVTCAGCHKNIYESHIHTAHYLTSRPATSEYIKGSFDSGKNIYAYNKSVAVAMEKRGDSFYQVEYYKTTERKVRRFDIVVGSGTMGQSYLYWQNNHLFQLPITYFSAAQQWSNSPGFPDKVVFNRPITARCLECHTTFIKTLSVPVNAPEEFDHEKILYGIDCEKCHGPSRKHVEFQTQNPSATIAKYIINPSRLSRQQNLDLCASCHGGRLQKLTPSFEFTVGDTLSNYFVQSTAGPNPDSIDVHGNQYGLLRKSKCFAMSQMTCTSCHNTHQNEKGKIALFSQRCMTCHNDQEHQSIGRLTKSVMKTNCVDCHMPLKPSNVIAVQLHGDSMPMAALIRSHFITIYPDETKKVIAVMKKLK